jgi:putative oxidoreductase
MSAGEMMNSKLAPLLAVARVLMAYIFIRGGINKLGAIAATAAQMGNHGIPFPELLVWGAIAMELGGGLLLATGLYARWAALALFFYTFTLALLFHHYWADPDAAAARTDAAFFYGHLSMMGGMLYVVVFGAGSCSLDRMMGRWNPTSN